MPYTAEINEPVSVYQNHLAAEFAENTSRTFEDMLQKSGVDPEENANLVKCIRELEKIVAKLTSKLGWARFFRNLMIFFAIAGAFAIGLYIADRYDAFENFSVPLWCPAGGAAALTVSLLLIFLVLNKKIAALSELLDQKQEELSQQIAAAWAQMEPLNRLFQWNTVAKLIMQTLPMFKLDKFFSRARMGELINDFGWNGMPNGNNDSMLFCQSGALNGNPFLIGDQLHFEWDTKIYEGSLLISWEERESYTDANGRRKTRWVTKYQTLHATVEKPFPGYEKNSFLLYANNAAPDLEFSREPSALSDNSFFDKFGLKRTIRKLEKKSRDLDSGFTIMANEEFDAVFHAIDRSDERQFRLLFTPLAQQEMLKILRDQEAGYGDDFRFCKLQKLNLLFPEHLDDIDLSASPANFRFYELELARKTFNEFCNEYFRSFYFAFAPILAIPLYQQYRSQLDLTLPSGRRSSDWEWEAIANSYSRSCFTPHDSVTQNILKVEKHSEDDDGGSRLTVTAHGFRSVPRTDYVSVYGNDGKYHDVPVNWDEFLPVSKSTDMIIRETEEESQIDFEEKESVAESWRNFYRNWRPANGSVKFRRSIISLIPDL